MKRDWKQWFKAAGVRAIRTMAQTALAILGTSTYLGDANWKMAVSSAILAGILSILTSITGIPEVPDDIKTK